MDAPAKHENHTLRSATAIMLFLIAYAHFFLNNNYGYDYSQVLGEATELLTGFGRFAIPIFFMISGYYCYSHDGHSEARLGKKVLHIIYLIILLKVSYFILTLIALQNGNVDFDYTIRTLLTFEYQSVCHIWFLYALLLSYLIFWALYKLKIDFKKIYWLAWIPIALAFLFAEIIPLCCPEYISEDMFFKDLSDIMYQFIGITFFIFGYYLHRNKEKVDAMFSTPTLIMFMIFGTISVLVETRFIPGRIIYFGSILQIIGLFLITYRFGEDELRCRPLEFIGKNLMPFFYVYMMAPIFVCTVMLKDGIDPFTYYIICPVLCVIATLIIAAICYLALRTLTNGRNKARS